MLGLVPVPRHFQVGLEDASLGVMHQGWTTWQTTLGVSCSLESCCSEDNPVGRGGCHIILELSWDPSLKLVGLGVKTCGLGVGLGDA